MIPGLTIHIPKRCSVCDTEYSSYSYSHPSTGGVRDADNYDVCPGCNDTRTKEEKGEEYLGVEILQRIKNA